MLDLLNPREALRIWRLGDVVSATAPSMGTVNGTLLLRSIMGEYALRAYRRERGRVEGEHALIAYARRQGIPAVAPLPLPGRPHSATILERAGRLYAMFPRAPGRQFTARELGPAEITAMGRCLATLHRALAGYPHDRVAARSFTVDTEATLAGITTLEEAIHARPASDDRDRRALSQLAARRAWLEDHRYAGPLDLSDLERQVIHGDYQQTNLFFAEGVAGVVSAVIDWDQAYVAPRAWEVVRALQLVFDFAAAPCCRFLAAYRAELPLPLAELDIAAAAYSLMRARPLAVRDAVPGG